MIDTSGDGRVEASEVSASVSACLLLLIVVVISGRHVLPLSVRHRAARAHAPHVFRVPAHRHHPRIIRVAAGAENAEGHEQKRGHERLLGALSQDLDPNTVAEGRSVRLTESGRKPRISASWVWVAGLPLRHAPADDEAATAHGHGSWPQQQATAVSCRRTASRAIVRSSTTSTRTPRQCGGAAEAAPTPGESALINHAWDVVRSFAQNEVGRAGRAWPALSDRRHPLRT
jgi:hypothetical protein